MNSSADTTSDATAPDLPFRYLGIDAVLKVTGLGSKSNLYARIAAGTFPEPDRLTSRCSRWRSTDVSAWLKAQAAQSDAEREKRAARGHQHAMRMLAGRAKIAA